MLAKKFRLPIGKWIKEKKGKSINKKSNFFILKSNLNGLKFSRFGVVVSSKISKSAVRRNYIKRIILDFIRIEKLYEIIGKDYLIIVLPSISKFKKSEIEKELKKIL
ncbi:ribonuclease P protein component [Candidatus Wolfebacteria bacterium]|nr:ribonuclease P protein component [Candidatus Wolfebacteria bacterium]